MLELWTLLAMALGIYRGIPSYPSESCKDVGLVVVKLVFFFSPPDSCLMQPFTHHGK